MNKLTTTSNKKGEKDENEKDLLTLIDMLNKLRQYGNGQVKTKGLDDDTILCFAKQDKNLVQAIHEAKDMFNKVCIDEPDLLLMDEVDQILTIQEKFVNFYDDDKINPFVALIGKGPWIITLKGAVVHDSGGYGMLGLGHAPTAVLNAMNQHHIMANIMTPHLNQKKFTNALMKEIGHTRKGLKEQHKGVNTKEGEESKFHYHCPYDKFLCMNSGSEAVSVAARISDVNAKIMTDPNGQYANYKAIQILSLKGGFHGRTDRPAQFSSSTSKVYIEYLATFRDRQHHELIEVEPNNIQELQHLYSKAKMNNIFIESFFLEPVMGEGNPGLAITREFYDTAIKLTREHGSLLLVDSIQAGLRTNGVLSIIDYPNFQSAKPPDMETFSKAINAGQYPLSVLAMTSRASSLYRKGIYGNTMTTNPRSLDVACSVLNSITPQLRQNICDRGIQLKKGLQGIKEELKEMCNDYDVITDVQGTGLLVSAALNNNTKQGYYFKASGKDSVEEYMRMNGISVIHGGINSLRYTPHFNISSEEVNLIVDMTKKALIYFINKEQEEKAKGQSAATAATTDSKAKNNQEISKSKEKEQYHHHHHRRIQAGSIVEWVTF